MVGMVISIMDRFPSLLLYMSFKNCILVVVFNYSNCVKNKEFIKSIYASHFKHVIFYSDGSGPEPDVNYINIKRGYITHRIFKHFYIKYHHTLLGCDGLFYTMDDNIINVNILNLYDPTKIHFTKCGSK